MKKHLILSLIAMGAILPLKAQDDATTYPVPIERRVPWTIISGTDSKNRENNPLGGKTGSIADLIDRNPITFWHSNPDDCNGTSADHSHWFMIDRGIGASNIPFNTLSIQQRVINDSTNPEQQSFNGAVKSADIYVTNEFIGLLGGSANKEADDAIIYEYTQMATHTPVLQIEPLAYTQEAQLFQFPETQTGRFILVVITHTINPKGNGDEDDSKGTADQYACLSEFNLFMDTPENRVTESNFNGVYALGENPTNAQLSSKRTHMLSFSVADATTGAANNVNTDAYRMSPLLQVTENPWIPTLNWLDWQGTFFDITNLMTVSAGNGMKFQIIADGAGNGLYKALYIDWDEDGFDEADKVIATESTVNLKSTLEAVINVETAKLQKNYRARYIVDGQNTSPTPSADIANGGIVVDFALKIEKPVTFNVNLKFEDKVIGTIENVSGYANVPFTIATPDFFDVDVIAVAPEDDGVIDVNLRRFVGLPFMFSESLDNAVWQAVQQNFPYKLGQASATDEHHNFTWTYNPDENAEYLIETEPSDVNTEGFTDNQLWAFVGDMFNGFTIYNKAAGVDKCIYVDGDKVKLGEATDNNLWKAYYAPGREYSQYCTLKAGQSNYLSFSNVDGNALGFSEDASGSATCWFVAPSAPMLEQVAEYNFDYNSDDEPSNFPETRPVGSFNYAPGADFTGFQETIDAATADPYDYELSNQLREIINYYETNVEYVTLRTDKWYRITAAHNATGWVDHFMHTNNTTNNLKGENIKTTRKQNYFSLFNFIAVPDQENRYYIQSQEKFIGRCNGNSAVMLVDTPESAGQFTLVDVNNGPAKFAIKDMTQNGTNNCLHKGQANTVNITGWASSAGGSQFYILPASDVEVPLNETIAELGHVDFVNFPFPVKADNDGTKLYTLYAGYDNSGKTAVPVVSYVAVDAVAANTPCMVVNEERTTATLLIDSGNGVATLSDEPATTPAANILGGTIRSKSAEAGDYTVSASNGKISFVKSTEAPVIKNNYVFIPSANLSEDHKNVDTLPLNDPLKTDATGIVEISADGAATVIYDLQGRRLAAPVKGLNIINGVKVIR